jgi:hypothetical protein
MASPSNECLNCPVVRYAAPVAVVQVTFPTGKAVATVFEGSLSITQETSELRIVTVLAASPVTSEDPRRLVSICVLVKPSQDRPFVLP